MIPLLQYGREVFGKAPFLIFSAYNYGERLLWGKLFFELSIIKGNPGKEDEVIENLNTCRRGKNIKDDNPEIVRHRQQKYKIFIIYISLWKNYLPNIQYLCPLKNIIVLNFELIKALWAV
jgi:hypothetical protein